MRLLVVAGLTVFYGVLVFAQTPAEGPTLTPIWDLKGDFAAPESAYYHAASNSVFVSSINGQILERDGNGYISRLSPDGKVISAKWVTELDAPKGMRSVGNTLWVSDIDDVVSIDIAKGQITARVLVNGAQFLNDLATAPDGTVYVSDSAQSRIYAVKDGKSSIFVEGGDVVEQPNGLLVDGSRLILGSIGPAPQPGAAPGRGRGPAASGHLYAFDLKTAQRTPLTSEAVGGIDGIEPDGSGGLLVTDVIGQRLLHVAKSGQVRVLAKFSAGGADFGYIGAKRIAVVPFLFENRVAAYDLTNALK
jgi:DNA-binding beta-propeller fold protein YncE